MTYFDCFVVVAWTFAFGWFVGAIYVQNHKEKTQRPQVVRKLERCEECGGLRAPISASAAAD
ncbi:MAG TPA: hypothetical protein VMD99_00830 [Terriglobales bacterium]|nr:hypothetical protein [Terriglobales bacterium]